MQAYSRQNFIYYVKLNQNVVAEQVIIEMTDGGADYCFECVGMTSLVHEAYASCRKVYVTLSDVSNTHPHTII